MNIAVIGGGSWGLALSQVLNDNGNTPKIYHREPVEVDRFNTTHTSHLLPEGVVLVPELKMSSDLTEVLDDVDYILVVVPTNAVRNVLTQVVPLLKKPVTIINAAKGIEQNTHKRISEVVEEIVPPHLLNAYVALTGPSHAEEVAVRQFTAIVAASKDEKSAEAVQDMFNNDHYFRVYTTTDIVGAEIGGALKNIIALASGYLEGKGYGDNTKAALLTRGIAEMTRFGVALGAEPLTFAGLTGVGDLIVTATSRHSRNFQAGHALAKGTSIDELLNSNKTIEGVKTTFSAYELSKEIGVDMPITAFIYHVLNGTYTAEDFGRVLFSRDVKPEQK